MLKRRAIRRHDDIGQLNVSMIERLTGMLLRPVPGSDSLKVPTNIEENGTVVDDTGNFEGYAEEHENVEEHLNPGIDQEADEDLQKKQEEEKVKQKEKERGIIEGDITTPM